MRFQYLTKAQALLMNLDDKKDVMKDSSAFIQGVMKVGIIRAKNLIGEEKGKDDKLKSDPLVIFKFKNEDKYIKYTTDEIESNLNPIWNEDMSFGVKILKGGAIPPFEIEVYDHDTWSANDLIGAAKIKPDVCFEKPCTWAINSFFLLKEGEKNLPAGEIYIRAYFVPDGTFDPNENARDVETGEVMLIKTGKAKLHFRVVAGRELVYLKDGIPQPKASPYVELQYPNGKSSSSKPGSDTLNPNWYYNYMGSVDLPDVGSSLAPVIIAVKNKTGILSSDVLMSQVKVDLRRCVDNKGKWVINEMVPIPGEEKFLRPNNLKNMGSVYVQAKIVESTRVDDDVEPETLIEMPKIGAGEIKGNLFFNLVHCKDLPKVDSGMEGSLCDPQVDFSTKGGTTVESSVIWNNLNPVWNKVYVMPYKVSGIADVQPLTVTIYDKDKMSMRDLVGSIQTDLMPCLSNPNKWGINKIFNIENIEEKYRVEGETPQIYFQAKFLPEGQVDNGEQAQMLEDIERTIKDRKRKGKLLVRIIHARGLIKADSGLAGSLSDPYAKITLPPNGNTYKTEVIKNTLIPHWKKEFVHPIEINDIRYVNPALIEVYDYDNLFAGGTDDLIGNVEIDIKPALNDSNVWAINKVFEMSGPSKLKEKLKLKNFGNIYVQMLFLPDGEKQTPKEPALVEDIVQLAKEAEVKGTLLVNVVHAKDLMRNDKPYFGGGPGSSDPFVRVKWPNGNESKTKARDGTITPVWNELLKAPVELNKLNIPLLFVEVIDNDTFSNDQLGYCNVDLDACVNNPGKWMVNGNQTLEGGPKFVKEFKAFGEVYVQAMFLLGSATHDGTLPPVNENLKEVIERAAVKGTIEIRLIHGEGLKAGDNSGKSDPFVTFTMPDKKEVKSNVIKDSINPVWNQEIKYPISITTTTVEPIFVKVLDRDPMFDDELGKTSFQIFECLKNPGKWLVDSFLKIEPLKPVEDKKAKPEELGEIYIQARFVKEGMTDNTPPPPLKKDLGKLMQDKRIDGKLVVRLVHCKGLHVENPAKCKVFAEARLGDGDSQATNYCTERNPFFNHHFEFPLKLESVEFLKPLIVTIKEKFMIQSSVVGEATIDLIEMTKQPKNTWFLNKIMKIQGPEKLAKQLNGDLGEIYVQCKLLPPGESNYGESLPLLEDIKLTTTKERIRGKLIVYAINVMDVIPEDGTTCDPMVEIHFNNAKRATPHIEKTINAEFKKKLEFEANFEGIDLVPLVEVKVLDHDTISGNDEIGYSTIDVKECIKNPDVYHFNQVLKLEGPPNLLGKYRTFGSAYIQVKFLKEGSQDQDNFAPMLITMEQYMQKFRIKGKLFIHAVHAKYLLRDGGMPDPFLKFTFPNKKEDTTRTAKKTNFPSWMQIITTDIEMSRNDAGFVDVEIIDSNFAFNSKLGKFAVDVDPCYGAPNTWAVNKVFQVEPPKDKENQKKVGECGTVYLQVKFLPDGQSENPAELIGPMLDTTPEEDRKKEGLFGTLKVIAKSGRDLANKDSGWGQGVSDPYVLFKLPDGQEWSTKYIGDNLNPDWNEDHTFTVKIDKDQFRPIDVLVKDKDNMGSDDTCGVTSFGIDALKNQPNTWAINNIFPLKDGNNMKGSVYILAKFIPEGGQDNGIQPQYLAHK